MWIQAIVWFFCCIVLPLLIFYLFPFYATVDKEIYKSLLSPAIIHQPLPNVLTVYDLFLHACKRFSSKPMLGSRSIIKTVTEEKNIIKQGVSTTKSWTFFHLSDYQWVSYQECLDTVAAIGSALHSLGLKPKDKCTLYNSTSRDWMLMALGCFHQNICITTAYDTLGEQGLSFSIQECEITCLFTNADLLHMIQRILDTCPTLKTIIYNPSVSGQTEQDIQPILSYLSGKGIKCLTLKQVIEMGQKKKVDPVPPKSVDLCCIMYTSGSTGNPKGVMLTHGNVVAGVSGVCAVVNASHLEFDSMLAYLPLAHILEFLLELFCIFQGTKIGYGSVRTLTDSSVRHCKGDICTLKPSLMPGVPAVWETIRKGVLTKLDQATPMKRRIFDLAFHLKWIFIKLKLPTHIFDKIVFGKIKEQTGGRLKLLVSGGAPIPKETQQFLTVCVSPMVQGYGMTECVGACSVQLPSDQGSLGHVGPPTPNCEIKLVSFDCYNASEGKGEIWVRGPTVMKGYYKLPEQTAETLTEDGWLMTGDIGHYLPNGCLTLIDRKKNLVKLAHGEYIALEKLEAQYKTCVSVLNLCVVADPLKSAAVGIVAPIEASLKKYIEDASEADMMDLSQLCKDARVIKGVFEELKKAGVNAGFKSAEFLGAITLVPDEWTSVNGLLTAAQKIKRKEIQAKYAPEVAKMYASL